MEITGLMITHVDLEKGRINIVQRNWRGDIDTPKTAKSRRLLALGALTPRYKAGSTNCRTKVPPQGCSPRRTSLKRVCL